MHTLQKPVLLLQSRPEHDVSDHEFEAIYQLGNIVPERIERLQIGQGCTPKHIDPTTYAAIILGGGPANFAYDEVNKSTEQKQFEPWLLALMQQIIATDTPFLGLCLGVGAMALGVKPDFVHGETVAGQKIYLTDQGRIDLLLVGLPMSFFAFVGHKEGVSPELPCEVLAVSDTCAQIIRTGNNVYAAQFHPELDQAGLELRVRTYRHHGYFKPEEIDTLLAQTANVDISHAPTLLRNFGKRYIV